MTLLKHIRTAEAPTGQRYTVVAVPPGSALDAGTGRTRGGVLGVVLAVVAVLARSMRQGWRIAVTPRDERGRPSGATYRERVADEQGAEAQAQNIVGRIRSGQWPEEPQDGAGE